VFWRLQTVLTARIGSIAHASPFPITPLRRSRFRRANRFP
jgi:hypothetical protein